MVGATTRLRCTPSVEEWTVEDVCRFVQGLSQEFGDQASVYAAAMKEQAIDGKALLHLSAANLEELKKGNLLEQISSHLEITTMTRKFRKCK